MNGILTLTILLSGRVVSFLFYSERSACIGSTEAPRRAGRRIASIATSRTPTATAAYVRGSLALTPKSRERKRFVAQNVPASPHTTHDATSTIPWPSTCR